MKGLDSVLEYVRRVPANKPYAYSWYPAGTNWQLRVTRGVFSNGNDIYSSLIPGAWIGISPEELLEQKHMRVTLELLLAD